MGQVTESLSLTWEIWPRFAMLALAPSCQEPSLLNLSIFWLKKKKKDDKNLMEVSCITVDNVRVQSDR